MIYETLVDLQIYPPYEDPLIRSKSLNPSHNTDVGIKLISSKIEYKESIEEVISTMVISVPKKGWFIDKDNTATLYKIDPTLKQYTIDQKHTNRQVISL